MALFEPQQDQIGDEWEELLDWIDGVDWDDLTDWESDFLESMRDKLEEYKSKTFITERQREVIEKIKAKNVSTFFLF